MSETGSRPQAVNGITKSTLIMSNVITFLLTLIIAGVSMYFFTINIHASARESVVKDMQLASSSSKQSQQK